MTLLTRELTTYQQRLPELLDHVDEYVLIKGTDVVGFFPNKVQALEEGYKNYRDGPFLVRQILPDEPVRRTTRIVEPG